MSGTGRPTRTGRLARPGCLLWCALAILGVSSAGANADLRSAASNEGLGAFLWPDEHGISVLQDGQRRTPTGLLIPAPFELAPFSGESLLSRGAIEFGGIASFGDKDDARFIEYADWSDGFLLRRFALDIRQAEGGGYLELGGGSVGRDDQFYRIEAGRLGWGRIRSRFDSLRHVYADDARVLFTGAGTEVLGLPPGLPVGTSSVEELTNALSTVGQTQLSQRRDVTGVDFRIRLLPDLNLFADYRLQRRTGERPFGGTLGMTMSTDIGGSVIETLEPIQSRTHDWSAGVEWASRALQVNLAYRGSVYDTNRSSLTWENPFPLVDLTGLGIPGLGIIDGYPEGRSALSPDNQLHQFAADVGAALPARGRFTANVNWTRMSQNQSLLPATINPAQAGRFAPLSRNKAKAQVDRISARSMLRFRPLPKLTLQLRGSYSDRKNETDYFSFNPETNEYGYIVEDTVEVAPRVGAAPFDAERWNVEGRIQWRPIRHTRLGLEYEHEVTNRANRARRVVSDDRIRLQVSTRAVPETTVRLSYEFQDRNGSAYNPLRDQRYYAFSPGSTLPAGPGRSLREFRQPDLADHERHDIQLRVNWLVAERIDLTFMGRYQDTDFGAAYGVREGRTAEANVEVASSLSPTCHAYGFATFEWRERSLTSINGIPAGVAPGDFVAGGPVFPLANRWHAKSEALTVALGTGIAVNVTPRLRFEADYQYLWSDDKTSTSFDRAGGALPFTVDPATARTGFPAQRLTDHTLDLALRFRVSEPLELKALYRLQRSGIADFHQQGLVPLINHNLYLAIRDTNYTASVFALTAVFRY